MKRHSVLLSSLLLISASAFAGPEICTPEGMVKPKAATQEEYNQCVQKAGSIVGCALRPPNDELNQNDLSMKVQYCNAYKVSQQSAQSNQMMGRFWAGATLVCGGVCVCQRTPGCVVSPTICTVPAGGALTTEMTQAQNMQSGAQSLIGGASGTGLLDISGGKIEVGNPDACEVTEYSAMQTVGKMQAAQSANQTAQSSLQSAGSMAGGGPTFDWASGTKDKANSFGSGLAQLGASNDPCFGEGFKNAALCAAKNDPSAMDFLSKNSLEAQYKSMTGKDLNSALGADTSLQGVAKALAEQFPGNPQVAAMAKMMAEAQPAKASGESNANSGPEAVSVVSAGRMTGGASDPGAMALDPELAALLEKLGAMGKGRKPSSEDQRLAKIAFEIRKNGPSSPNLTAADFSLFDRTTFRYRVIDNAHRMSN